MQWFMGVVLLVIAFLYVCVFLMIFPPESKKKKIVFSFHQAIVSIYGNYLNNQKRIQENQCANDEIDDMLFGNIDWTTEELLKKINKQDSGEVAISNLSDVLEQLSLNYNQLSQEMGLSKDSMVSDSLGMLNLLDSIIHYYDTYTDKKFKTEFKIKKNENIRRFVFEIRKEIMSREPYITIPPKEAGLLKAIRDSIEKNNKELGRNSLIQLSKEMTNKEKTLKRMERANQISMTISIVGVILTVVFGILSLFKFSS